MVRSPHVQTALAVLLALLGAWPGHAPGQEAPPIDRERMETLEDLSESLANDLLDLSVAARQQDLSRVSTYFAADLRATPLPVDPSELEPRPGGLSAHGWYFDDEPRALSAGEFLAAWRGFFGHFSELEDVRFKVKGAEFEGATAGEARVFFFVVGRDRARAREWVRGWARVEARRETGDASQGPRWRITRFVLETIESLVSSRDLFSEVGAPAGVAHTIPRYGTPGNGGFVWHGAAAADVDRDGDVDLFVTGRTQNFLYLNRGDGTFREAPAGTGVEFLPQEGVAPLFLDADNDGDEDLFISAVGIQMFLENRLVPDGTLSFLDVSIESGVDIPAIGFSAVAGDVDGDGLPDIYVASYNWYGRVLPSSWDHATNGTPNLLFVNQGGLRFAEQAERRGVQDRRWSYAAQFADVDGDGDQDLYVANDFGENGLFVNEGGRFVDRARERGVVDPGNGMGVSFGDYDNDGDLDLFVSNMSSTAGNRILGRLFPASDREGTTLKKLASGNSLYENLGDGTFRDVTAKAGGFAAGWAWGGGFFDYDNDGHEDVYTPNGFISGKSMKDT